MSAPHSPGGLEQSQGQQVGGEDRHCLPGVDGRDLGTPVRDPAAAGRVLDQRREEVAGQRRLPFLLRVGHEDLDVQRRCARADHLQGLRVYVAADDETPAWRFGAAPRQLHGLGGGRGFVQQRGIGNRHGREVADHGLEVDEGLHAALRDLGLVGRVGRVPGRVFKNVALDDAWRMATVVALADEAFEDAAPARQCLELGQRLGLAHGGGQVHGPAAAYGGRHDGIHQRRARCRADDGQHVRFIRSRQSDMARHEFMGVFQGRKAVAGGRRRHQHGGTSLSKAVGAVPRA